MFLTRKMRELRDNTLWIKIDYLTSRSVFRVGAYAVRIKLKTTRKLHTFAVYTDIDYLTNSTVIN